MGRGQHPLRGRWKPRVQQKDVTLNLGESAPIPPGQWGAVVHDHDSMWMAKWIDKLTGKEKYVWLHESSPLQQSRNKAKYDNAFKVGKNLQKIRGRILKGLESKDERTRQVATVCYLIDTLGMRVGDEKDEDEADTVGASTLRVEHVKSRGSDVEFNFLGKDSVPWNKKDTPPPAVVRNLREFTSGKAPEVEIFHDVSSGMVNGFLSSIVPGLSAKVFRTYHATAKTEEALSSRDVRDADDLDKLYHAKEANLKAAIFCNHQRTPPKTWEQSLEKKKQKLMDAKASRVQRQEGEEARDGAGFLQEDEELQSQHVAEELHRPQGLQIVVRRRRVRLGQDLQQINAEEVLMGREGCQSLEPRRGPSEGDVLRCADQARAIVRLREPSGRSLLRHLS